MTATPPSGPAPRAPQTPQSSQPPHAHPYIPNSAPGVKRAMLDALGAGGVEDFYADIPEHLRLRRPLDLPAPLRSEAQLVRHVGGLLARNTSTREALSFLGAGCYPHHVPAVVDEVVNRSEFLTAYAGEPYEDHGRFQAMWEYQSLMAELLEAEVVNVPVYDGFQAAGTALRMAGRLTGRARVLAVSGTAPDKLSKVVDYVRPEHQVVTVPPRPDGRADLDAVRAQLAAGDVAAVWAEAPTYTGLVDEGLAELAELAHGAGALYVVGCNPASLGVLAPPSAYGADIACGDLQPLGIHMSYGGGNAGFVATQDDERLVAEFPTRLFGLVPTAVEGEYGFGDVAFDRTSFAVREEGKEWVGTASALHGIAAGVYLSLMGPHGMRELGETVLARTAYAKLRLADVPGVEIPQADAVHFADFPVRFTGSRTAAEVNAALREHGIFGGAVLPGSGGREALAARDAPHALFCVTEVHTAADIDLLADTLKETAL